MIGALLVAGLATVTPLPAVADSSAGSTGPADAQWAASDADAQNIASTFGHSVAVTSESTPTTEISALPNGQMQMVTDSVPQRVLVGGAWQPIDTTLTSGPDGFLAPKQVPAGVQFSSGGSDVMARIQSPDGSWADQTWPDGVLPAPTVSGSAATYASVLPGVDLILTATPSGMSEVFEVHSAEAAANPDLQALELGVQGATLSQDTVDSTVATFSSGDTIQAEEPLWWDSSASGAGAAGPGSGEPQPVSHSVASSHESLDISAIGSTPSVDYPMFVDPAWSSGDNDHWYDDEAYPDQSYLNGEENADWLATGYAVQDGITYRSRAFWQFPTGPLEGKTILDAHLTMTESESFDSSTVGLYLLETPRLTDGATWNQENATANVWAHLQSTFTPASGGNTIDVKNAVAWGVSASDSGLQFGLKSSNESDASGRKHWDLNATLAVTYDTKPNTPTDLKIETPQRACGTESSPAYVNNKASAITLEADSTDPDSGDTTYTTFSVSGVSTAPKSNGGDAEANGIQTAQIAAGALTDGTEYSWTAHSTDSHGVSGPTSGACYFTVDNDAPAWPGVTASASDFYVGHDPDGGFTATYAAKDHVAMLEYWWSDSTVASAAPAYKAAAATGLPACNTPQGGASFTCVTSTTATTLNTAPPDPKSVLWVAAIDAAGNVSAAAQGTNAGFWPAPNSGVVIQDDPDLTANPEHEWATSLLSVAADSPPTSVADQGGGSSVTVGSGLALVDPSQDTSVSSTGLPFGSAYSGAFSLPGYSMLERAYKSPDNDTVVEGKLPSGYAYQNELGEIASLDQAQPAGTRELFECSLSGDETTTTSPTCSGEIGLGYIWTAAANVPLGVPVGTLYGCSVTSTGERFDWTDSSCDGQTVVSLIGYVAETTPNATATGEVVDTAKSFSVGAWVYPEQSTGGSMYHTIMSESPSMAVPVAGSTADSGFYLQEAPGGSTTGTSPTGGALRLCVYGQGSTLVSACATGGDLPLNQWTFVVGIFDAGDHQLTVQTGTSIDEKTAVPYTPPAPAGSAADASATGPVLVGSAVSNGSAVNQWDGLIMNPVVAQGVFDSAQMFDGYNLPQAAD